MRCPDDHRHGATTTCYYTHGCRCDGCMANVTNPSRLELGMGARLKVVELCRWVGGAAETVRGVPLTPTKTHHRLQRDRETVELLRHEWAEIIE